MNKQIGLLLVFLTSFYYDLNGSEKSSMDEAIKNGKIAAVTQLLNDGFDLETPMNHTENSPLQEAVIANQPEIAQLLIMRGADVNKTDYQGITALWRAPIFAYARMVQLLLENNADPTSRDHRDKRTPLINAAEEPNIDVVKLLVLGRADIDAQDHIGRTALMKAARYDRDAKMTALKFLLQCNANTRLQDSDGETALSLAINNLNDVNVELLLTSKADMTIPNKRGETVLDRAKYFGESKYANRIKQLLDAAKKSTD